MLACDHTRMLQGNAAFFTVKRIEDAIGLLPAKLILGINKRGVSLQRCHDMAPDARLSTCACIS